MFKDAKTETTARKNAIKSAKKSTLFLSIVICIVVIGSIISGIIIYNHAYDKGFADNQPMSKDGSYTVYITPTGKKYHTRNCSYLKGNEISISVLQATKKGYGSCSRCKPSSVAVVKSNTVRAKTDSSDRLQDEGVGNRRYVAQVSVPSDAPDKSTRRINDECLVPGCSRNPYGNYHYCSDHRCKYSGCDSAKSFYGYYCYSHTCKNVGCKNPVKEEHKMYCHAHNCKYQNGYMQKDNNSKYCNMHKRRAKK